MGRDNVHGEGLRRVAPQGGSLDDTEATSESMGWSLGLSPSGGHPGGGGIAVSGDLCLSPPEHSRTVYCDQDHYVPVSIKGVVAAVMGG